MRHLLQRWFEQLADAYWLIPLLWLLGGTGFVLGLNLIPASAAPGAKADNIPLVTLVVGSSLTVISMLLSGSLVALTLTTSQYGPRLLRGFLHDTVNKHVLGSYLGLAGFGLMLLGGLEGDLPPLLSTRLCIAWLIANLFLLVVFMHRLIQSMIVERVLEQACRDIRRAVSPPSPFGPTEAEGGDEEGFTIQSSEKTEVCWPEEAGEGFLLQIDYEKLVHDLEAEKAVLDLCVTSGDWLHPGKLVAHGSAETSTGELAARFSNSCHLGPRRTPIQDERYAFERITEIALRALSPGIHDPFTAITCIEHAAAELRELARGDWPPPPVRSEEGALRIRPARASIGELAVATFAPIIEVRPAERVRQTLKRELASIRGCLEPEDLPEIDKLCLALSEAS